MDNIRRLRNPVDDAIGARAYELYIEGEARRRVEAYEADRSRYIIDYDGERPTPLLPRLGRDSLRSAKTGERRGPHDPDGSRGPRSPLLATGCAIDERT